MSDEKQSGIAKMITRVKSQKNPDKDKKDDVAAPAASSSGNAPAPAAGEVPEDPAGTEHAMPRNITVRAKERVTKVMEEVANEAAHALPTPVEKVIKTEEEWKAMLSEAEYNVLRKGEIELQGMDIGTRLHSDKSGIFICRCCNEPLFSMNHQAPSQIGMLTFTQTLPGRAEREDIEEKKVSNLALHQRVKCHRCDAVIGFVGMPLDASDAMKKVNQPIQVNKSSLLFLEALVPKGSKRTSTRIGFASVATA